MYHESYQDRHYRLRYRRRSSSAVGAVIRFIVFIMVGIAVLAGGLWLVGATIGLVVGLFALALGLAPVLFVGWLVWLIIRAILF